MTNISIEDYNPIEKYHIVSLDRTFHRCRLCLSIYYTKLHSWKKDYNSRIACMDNGFKHISENPHLSEDCYYFIGPKLKKVYFHEEEVGQMSCRNSNLRIKENKEND